MTKRAAVRVRCAQPDDAEALAVLGRALNTQEGDPSTYFTAEAVRRDVFGDTPRFVAWLAEIDDATVG
jgi:hypothetical protein